MEETATVSGEVDEQAAILREESIDYFVSFVQMFGMPKSIGQIYGLLFVSARPLPMDEIVSSLGISKGSASQGLSLLRSLGAVTSHAIDGDRREHFEADLNVSRLVTHFFENRMLPRIESGENRIARMLSLAEVENGDDESEAVSNRIRALQKWHKRGKGILPIVASWLKR